MSFFIKPKTAEKRFLVLFNRLVSSIWHNGHEAGEFDRFGHSSLVFVAELVPAACGNLKLGSDILPEKLGIFIINPIYIVLTKFALHVI